MILTLDVTGAEAARLGAATRKIFHAAGGTIGRSPDNEWVLPDPHVSGHHAVVRYESGVFYLEDTSTNGVFVNSPDNRLVRGQQYALKSGDRIGIEPFEIRACITKASTPDPGSPFYDPFHSAPADPGGLAAEDVDPLNLLGFDAQRVPLRDAPRAASLASGSVLHEHYQPPVLRPVDHARPGSNGHGPFIPDDYDPLLAEDRPLAPLPAPVTPVPAVVRKPRAERLPERPKSGDARAAEADVGLAAVLAGAGLEDVAVTPDLARCFGQMLRVVVAGIMDVLQARQQTKEEFRMGMTRFKPADNNPLKFSANVDDALHNLLVKRNAAYLAPVEAFEDAFEDLRNHQMATLAGLRVAFEAMLAEFHPDRLQEQFDREGRKASLLPLPGRLRYWDRYRDKFHEMVRDADTNFRELFGDEFARAYEEQLKRLKAVRRERQH